MKLGHSLNILVACPSFISGPIGSGSIKGSDAVYQTGSPASDHPIISARMSPDAR